MKHLISYLDFSSHIADELLVYREILSIYEICFITSLWVFLDVKHHIIPKGYEIQMP